jgi:hypothetical protein
MRTFQSWERIAGTRTLGSLKGVAGRHPGFGGAEGKGAGKTGKKTLNCTIFGASFKLMRINGLIRNAPKIVHFWQ